MNNWIIFKESDEAWQTYLDGVEHVTYFHTASWAVHMKSQGWTVCRWACIASNKPIALVQGFLKCYPMGYKVLWFPDWIAGDLKCGSGFFGVLTDTVGLKKIYLRFRSTRNFEVSNFIELQRQGWRQPKTSFNSGLTMTLNLAAPIDKVFEKLSPNWRKSLRRSERENIQLRPLLDAQTVITLYAELRKLKGLSYGLYSASEVSSIMSAFGDQILGFVASGPDGNDVAIRAAIIQGDKAYDIFAAANEYARNHYVSHGLFWHLLKECNDRGVSDYDLNGIDPVNNAGVYFFKSGTGAVPKLHLGEFEWANSTLAKFVVNFRAARHR